MCVPSAGMEPTLPALTAGEIARFKTDGFLIKRSILSPTLLVSGPITDTCISMVCPSACTAGRGAIALSTENLLWHAHRQLRVTDCGQPTLLPRCVGMIQRRGSTLKMVIGLWTGRA